MAYGSLPANIDSLNPVQRDEAAKSAGYTGYNDYLDQKNRNLAGAVGGNTTTTSAVTNPLDLAKQAQQLQIQANQPAIQTLNTQKSSLDQKYDDLLKSIDASQGVALDKQTLATNSELAKRGITADSGIAQTEQASAALPVTTQFGQLKANTGVQREQDLNTLAANIASLQAGNVPGALSFSTGVGSLQNQAQQIANNYSLGTAQLAQPKQTDRYVAIPGGGLYDTQTGQTIQGIDALKSGVNNNGGW